MDTVSANVHGVRAKPEAAFIPLVLNSDGFLPAVPVDALGNPLTTTIADNMFTPGNGLSIASASFKMLYNGTRYDKERGNTEETYLANAARAAVGVFQSADFTNFNARGLHAILNVTALVGTPSITLTIEAKDSISGLYYNLLSGLPITTVGINIIKIYPGISAVVNASASDILPRTYRISVNHTTADSITYSVSGSVIL